VVDFSHPNYLEHIVSVQNTLGEIDATEKPTILVYNKVDQVEDSESIDQYLSRMKHNEVYISARKNLNIDRLKDLIFDNVRRHHEMIYPNYLNGQQF